MSFSQLQVLALFVSTFIVHVFCRSYEIPIHVYQHQSFQVVVVINYQEILFDLDTGSHSTFVLLETVSIGENIKMLSCGTFRTNAAPTGTGYEIFGVQNNSYGVDYNIYEWQNLNLGSLTLKMTIRGIGSVYIDTRSRSDQQMDIGNPNLLGLGVSALAPRCSQIMRIVSIF